MIPQDNFPYLSPKDLNQRKQAREKFINFKTARSKYYDATIIYFKMVDK